MTCPLCAEHAAAWRYGSLSSAERWDIWEHAQECDVLAVQVAWGKVQLLQKALALRLALAGVAVGAVEVVLPARVEEVVR